MMPDIKKTDLKHFLVKTDPVCTVIKVVDLTRRMVFIYGKTKIDITEFISSNCYGLDSWPGSMDLV